MTNPRDRLPLLLLKRGQFVRRERGGGWRFGTKVISDTIVDRLIATGHAATDGKSVWRLSGTSKVQVQT